MRLFYEQHALHRYSLSLEDVRDHVQECLRVMDDSTYTDEMADHDLRTLIEWGNLSAEQDRGRVRTVDEWLRRRLRYQITPYGIAFERLLVELEQALGQGGSLDPTALDSLWERLTELDRVLRTNIGQDQESLQRVRRLWLDTYGYFDQTGKDAADYLAALHKARPQELTELTAFLDFKDVLLHYLGSFLKSLLDYADKIQALLQGWGRRQVPSLLVNLLVLHDIQYVAGPDGLLPEVDTVQRHYTRQVQAFQDYFQRRGGVDLLRGQTADAIEMVVRHSQRLMERRRFGLSRRRELEELARCFAACGENQESSDRLAALAFATIAPRHILGGLEAYSMSDRGSVWAASPFEVPLSRISRGRQVRARSAPLRDTTLEQQAMLIDELDRRRQEAAFWDRLFSGGEINLGRLRLDNPAHRLRLLDLVGRCLAAPDHTALASDGSRVRLCPPVTSEKGQLVAPDGVLITPQFILKRESEEESR